MSSYIGKEPVYGVFIMQSATGDGSTTTITLNATAADATQLMVSVGGLLQKPRTAFTLNTLGTTLTFSEAPASGIEIFLVFLGKQLTGPRIEGDAITAQPVLATSPASDDTFLIYDESSSALKKVAYSNVHSGAADMAANTVKVRDAATTGAPSDKVLTTTQILIGDGTGFTAAALSGDVTMDNTGDVTLSATGTADATTFLRGDNAWTVVDSVPDLTTEGDLYKNYKTFATTITIPVDADSNQGLIGPISFTGDVTITGDLTIW